MLMEPVRDRLFFAGEAVHETLWGTVGGAWESASARPMRALRLWARRAESTAQRFAAMSKPKALIAWSSGKDSAWALHEVRRAGDYDIVGALTTVTETFGRVSMHGVREEFLRAQQRRLACRLIVPIPFPCPNEIYEARMAAALEEAKRDGVTHVIFGDLFLEDVRAYRERSSPAPALRRCFPCGCARPTRWRRR